MGFEFFCVSISCLSFLLACILSSSKLENGGCTLQEKAYYRKIASFSGFFSLVMVMVMWIMIFSS